MRIGFFLRDLKIEGVQVVALRLAKEFITLGHQCDFICLDAEKELEIGTDINVHVLNIPKEIKYKKIIKYAPIFSKWLYKEDLKHRFDAILCAHGDTINIVSVLDDPRFIIQQHSCDKTSYESKNYLKKIKYRLKLSKKVNKKHIICVSKGMAEFISSITNCYHSISTIYNPFDIQEIKKLAKQPLDTFFYDNEYICYIGRLAKEKRLELLINAYTLIDKNIKLFIVGDGCEEYKESLLNLIDKLKLSDRVFIFPFYDNPFPIINKAQALILTSETEGFGNVLVEALICHTPIISVDCHSGPAEIMSGKLKHYLVKEATPKNIAHKINDLLLGDAEIDFEKTYPKYAATNIAKKYIKLFINISK
ncbi:hypothetical protein C9J21_09530 [Photobacterium phosphoreum]|uniref:glycosyltransferase n=1 Tax=Photobacterium phosphoreum TaxID=659 RepID=UPI000D1603B3|nr:glycosyltransferase [Photobacterium phosphoreum]PSW33002.1 hypothetical protein C9J21_09530 [Photobacterium phosphoreum]